MDEYKASTEPHGTASRTTRDGRKITYEMNVIQQPERARACGSGAKSSTDRRPVDPPPIVRLNIYEGDGETRLDITARYNANFFLFATLENAKSTPQGRVAQMSANLSSPVLTGVPVAALYYLERPEKAGYFIFSDISVRHEGMYRITFTLYEETKDENDKDWSISATSAGGDPNTPLAHQRLEVKSNPFQVFSAKKFPGLFESTTLSRLVADQGCRVRIRRDIRLRKHETKAKDWEDKTKSEDWEPYDNRTISDEPRVTGPSESRALGACQKHDQSNRTQSLSEASAKPHYTARRHSPSQDVAAPYAYNHNLSKSPSSPTSTAAPHEPYAVNGISPQSQFDANPQVFRAHATSTFQPQYQYGNPFSMPQAYAYMNNDGPHTSGSDLQMSHSRNQSHGNSGSGAPLQYGHNSYNYPPYSAIDYGDLRTPYRTHSQGPVQTGHIPTSMSNMYTPSSVPSNDTMLPPIREAKRTAALHEYSAYAVPSDGYHVSPIVESDKDLKRTGDTSLKRSFASTFDTRHIERPLHDGNRPKVPHWASAPLGPAPDIGKPAVTDDTEDCELIRLSYRRADGTETSKTYLEYP